MTAANAATKCCQESWLKKLIGTRYEVERIRLYQNGATRGRKCTWLLLLT